MKKGVFKNKLIVSSVIVLIIIVFFYTFLFPKLIGYVVEEQKKQVQFYFYDEDTNCSLGGYVFSGDELIGKSSGGYFNLTYENYRENLNVKENISLFGRLEDCFGQDSDLLFDKYWEAFEIKDYYFFGSSVFNFKTKINPNSPIRREMLGFIQPYKVKSELGNINIKRKNTLDDLSEINNYLNKKIKYVKDWTFTNESNYWQNPTETLKIEKGDCEDFSTALLSLFLSYNNSLNCFNIIFTSHVTTFCNIEDSYVYYDQGKTELKKEIKDKNSRTKSRLIELKQEYFEHYGINDTETRAYYAFNEQRFIEFSREEDFIEWQYALKNKKTERDILKELEKETSDIEEKYPPETIGLVTRKPTELPTLKGFFRENFLILFVLGIVFIFSIIILIRVNVKR